jgi:hypothetical protein
VDGGLGGQIIPEAPVPGRSRYGVQQPVPVGTTTGGGVQPTPVGTTAQEPYQLAENGEVVSDTPLNGAYQYTAVGNDTYLDVTDPSTGQVRRFTGDVVQAAYSILGYSNFDEMVMGEGYDAAIQILLGFIAPPAAATTPGAGPGGLGPQAPVASPPFVQDSGPSREAGPVPGYTQ